jgi:hypothetical protein
VGDGVNRGRKAINGPLIEMNRRRRRRRRIVDYLLYSVD